MQTLNSISSRIFSLELYQTLVRREQARTVYTISIFMLVLTTLAIFTLRFGSSGINFFQLAQANALFSVPMLSFYTLAPASFILTRLGRLQSGSLVLLLSWASSFGLLAVSTGLYNLSTGLMIIIQIFLGGLLLGRAGLLLGTVLAVILTILGFTARSGIAAPTPSTNPLSDMSIFFFFMALFVGMVFIFQRFSRLSRQEGLDEGMQQRLALAELTTQITQRISSRINLQEVLDSTIDQITQNYDDIYHAQIFLIDESGQTARLVASTGEVGALLLERKHSLTVNSPSVIGKVTGDRKLIVARARSLNTIHRRNEYLPETLVEAAFPLLSGDRVVGALDLQSKKPLAFPDRDLPIYQTLADHIAISIDNARLFEESERRVEENRVLIDQSRNALREVERLNMRLTGRAWSEFLQSSKNTTGMAVDFATNKVQSSDDWTDTLQAAIQANEVIQQSDAAGRLVSVPLRVRGQAIGAMEFELDENGQLSPEDLELVEEISERFGLAVETARLYQESQSSAQRQALINEIGTKLQSANNIEATLSEAARSLQKTLKAHKVAIRLGAPPAVANGQNGGAE